MLVLTRRVGEALIINGNIKVIILGVERRQIKIGIEAPRDINIAREELLEGKDEHKTNR